MNNSNASSSQPNPVESSEQTPFPVASAPAPESPATGIPADGSRKHLLAPAASRSSSKADKQSTSDNTKETVNDDSENTLRGSKRSILKGRRDRSRGSSMRSRRQNQDSASMENRKPVTTPEAPDTPKPEKKKVSYKIFAFLSCCSSSNDDGDAAIPAKKTTKRQSISNRQPTPEKAESTPADSNTIESKEPNYYREEKPNPTVTSNHSPSQVDEDPNARLQAQGSQFSETSKAPHQPEFSDDQKSSEKDNNEGQTPAGVSQDISPVPAPEPEKKENPEGHVAPIVPDQTDDSTADPSKAMAKPLAETDPKEEAYSHDEQAVGLPAELPPPPPTAPPGQEGTQHWLLPPALPQLQNRKCLVLDLDETLVHSSFKVRFASPFTYQETC